jgi:hypothetical protein
MSLEHDGHQHAGLPACAVRPELFQDDDLIDPPSRRGVTAAEWRMYISKVEAARKRCAACPVLDECLYHAVVDVDIAGYLACTTEAQRKDMRRELGIEVADDDSVMAGARSGAGPMNHTVVLEARLAHPEDTYQQLANRLGCSLSTVKRHLRRARAERSVNGWGLHAALPAEKPSMAEVLDSFDRIDEARTA